MEEEQKLLFSDIFNIDKLKLDDYGAFDISLVADLPLFIDPFLLFNSTKDEYKALHGEMIKYLRFLKDKSITQSLNPGLISAWYTFKEVKQNWFGFTSRGNNGSALGKDFAIALNENFSQVFSNYGEEKITHGSHLEKLCLVKEGVGKDNISDFTTNLIKNYLLNFTQQFARQYLKLEDCQEFRISKSVFNYITETWEERTYYLPKYNKDFVILTPKDMLTKDQIWINKEELIDDFQSIPLAIDNEQLRAQINNYFRSILTQERPTEKDRKDAARKTVIQYPEIIDYYIKLKEDTGNRAKDISSKKVLYSENIYLDQFKKLSQLLSQTPFYRTPYDSYEEALKRAHFLKQVIENNDGYRLFYDRHTNQPIEREEDLKICYRLTWFGSDVNFDTEVNNGRGAVDGKASLGSKNVALIEFKLARNTQLERNLKNQVEVYQSANQTEKSIKVIIYFTEQELQRVRDIFNRLNLVNEKSIVLIDARKDNKPSASTA